MKTLEVMLGQHRRSQAASRDLFAATILELNLCEQVCTSCADACLAEEEHLPGLARCIRLNLDCAGICHVTASLITRQTEPDGALLQAQLHACALACQACADECGAHAAMHDHCATCAATCQDCQTACNRLLGELSSSGVRTDNATLEAEAGLR